MMGPPGSKRNEFACSLSEYFQWEFIQTGDCLRKEAAKSTPQGEKIKKCLMNFQYVDDDLVIEVVKKKIAECEKNKKSWIIEGFPRTRV